MKLTQMIYGRSEDVDTETMAIYFN